MSTVSWSAIALVSGLGAVDPQVLLEPVEAGPFLARFEVRLTQVEARVEVAEALGLRLDPLVVGAREREEPLGLVDVAGLDGGDELADRRDQRLGLAADVAAVASAASASLPSASVAAFESPVTANAVRMPSPTMPGRHDSS